MANGVIIRRNVDFMDAQQLADVRDAYAQMMAISATDNRSWMYWAGLHGYPNWYCWHHSRMGDGTDVLPYDLFLPWHRAFLLNFEHNLRDLNAGATLPWWDWTSSESHANGVPAAFSDAPTAARPNPLYSGPIPPIDGDPARQTQRFPGPPNRLPTPEYVNELLGLSGFEDFSNQIQNVHDGIHGWTGGSTVIDGQQVFGDMGSVPVSAFDPIFWSHHCMIDRLWYLWQLQNGVTNIPPWYKDLVLRPFTLTVRDVLDIRMLGYEYASSSAEVVLGAPAAAAAPH
jgi:tyrosinase